MSQLGHSVGVTGNAAWSFKGAHGRENYYWNGPGSRLYLLFGDSLVAIDHPAADGSYRTMKEASAALRRYLGVSRGRR